MTFHTVEEACQVLEGHADACGRRAERYRALAPRSAAAEGLASVNATKAETLRWAAQRVRELVGPRDEHFIIIDERGWVIEHSEHCRVNGHMAECLFTHFARDHINGSRQYPFGKFHMLSDDDYIVLNPVEA